MADYVPQETFWYTSALERLVAVVRELSQARDVSKIAAIVGDAARDLTGADGATFVLRDGTQCYYADESAIAPLWKGKRFPMAVCVSGWVMLNAEPAIIGDIYADPRVPAEAYRATFVKSLAMVPIRRNAPVGAIGNYWSENYVPSAQEVAILQALADTTSVALENAELYSASQHYVQTLEAQQARIQRQHASLEVFTSALAHDLKEPVRTLLSYSEMLREEPAKDVQAAYLSYVQNASGRMELLISAVARYMRLDELSQPLQVDCNLDEIAEVVRANLAALLDQHKSTLTFQTLPRLQADPAHLTELLQNLISNAVLHNQRPVTVTIRHVTEGGHTIFLVSDDGDGLRQNQAEQIFQPFRRLTHLQGRAGLGLPICRRIVELYGGEISCKSSRGQGATFIFSLPATEQSKLD